ncbi:MAG: HAD family hydrolase [Oligoflexia bacterium]|nr:HAD family hydrolase [Oligoflexia bacterium]
MSIMPIKLQKPKALIFDFDGTLVDSYPDILTSFRQAFAQAGLSNISFPDKKIFMSFTLRETVLKILHAQSTLQIHNNNSIDSKVNSKFNSKVNSNFNSTVESIVSAFKDIYDASPLSNTLLFDGALDLLKFSKKNDINTFIATNKRLVAVKRIIQQLGIEDYFMEIIAADSMQIASTAPPHPFLSKKEMICTLINKFSLPIDNTWMVGDSELDIRGATEAGIPSVAILDGYGFAESILKEQPTLAVNNIMEIKNLLRTRSK